MDLRKCELFADVAETGNFTASTGRMSYTQSSVSHIIKELGREMRFPLFVRTRRGVELTVNGGKIVPLIKQILSANFHPEQSIGELNGLGIGIKSIKHISPASKKYINMPIASCCIPVGGQSKCNLCRTKRDGIAVSLATNGNY
jgi:hypothetical protein